VRQLASTYIDGMIRYYLADSETGEIEGIAEVKAGPGFDPRRTERMIGLGFGLIHEAGYNGHARRTRTLGPVEPAALPPASDVERSGRTRRRPRSTSRSRRRWPLTIEEIIEFVAEHPDGVAMTAIGDELAPYVPETHARRQLIDNRVRNYLERCVRDGETPRLRTEVMTPSGPGVGGRRMMVFPA
jgi:hypothetical protein